MVSFEIADIKEFKNIIEVTEQYVPELRFDCNEDGVSFRALNQGHVVFIGCSIQNEWFDAYECEVDTSFMVDCFELKRVLGRIKGSGSLSCSLTDTTFDLKYSSTDGSTKTFKIGLISDLYDSPTPPNIDYPVTTMVEFDQLKEYSLDSLMYSDKVTFQFKEDNISIGSSNQYTEYEGKVVLLEDINEHCKVVISGEYLESFFKLNISDLVTLNVGDGMPFYATVISSDENLSYSVLIAPRIEED